jgi:hypothetical protein
MTAKASNGHEIVTLTGDTVSEIERAADAIGATRIVWPWGEVWRMMYGKWVHLS